MTASPLSSPIRSVQLEDHSLSLFISSSSQLRSLLSSTMENYTSLFSPEDTTQLPVFKLQLCLDEDAIQFFPTLEDLEAAVMFPLNTLASDILQSFPLIQVCTIYYVLGNGAVVCVSHPWIGCSVETYWGAPSTDWMTSCPISTGVAGRSQSLSIFGSQC